MTSEDRLERLLAADAERYRPATDGLARIDAKVRDRRRRRLIVRIGATVAAAGVVVAGGIALADGHSSPSRQHVAVGAPVAPTARVAGELIGVTTTRVNVFSASTGRLVRRVRLAKALPYGSPGQVAVDPTGDTAYVAIEQLLGQPSYCAAEILAVNTRTGAEHVAIVGGSIPALNPAGRILAYATNQTSVHGVERSSCNPTTVVTEDLQTGAKRSWLLSPPPEPGRSRTALLSLSWAPTGADLIVGDGDGPGPLTGIQILDTSRPASSTNPTTVGASLASHGLPGGRYTDPVELRNGRIVALAPYCWGGMSCPTLPPGQGGEPIEVVDRVTGRSTMLARALDPLGLLTTSGPNDLLVEGGYARSSAVSIYRLEGSRPVLLVEDAGVAAWADHGRP